MTYRWLRAEPPPMHPIVASLPSPSSGVVHLGPFPLHAYGLMIAIGILAGLSLARRRAPQHGFDRDVISSLALWGLPAGLAGARAYHVATDWRRFQGHWLDALKVWHGGLGIPGGMLAGIGVGLCIARRRRLPLGPLLDTVAPALPLAQAIGRWGNWWNQELFGRPTGLPWGLEIDAANRPPGYELAATFHPTFLYESIWNFALVATLLLIGRRGRLRSGQLFALYVAGYGSGRIWTEALRIDPASRLGPFRVNIWMSLVLLIGGIAGYVWAGRPNTDGHSTSSGHEERSDQTQRTPTTLQHAAERASLESDQPIG